MGQEFSHVLTSSATPMATTVLPRVADASATSLDLRDHVGRQGRPDILRSAAIYAGNACGHRASAHWSNVTPALHTPLMAVTNAISAIVIVGAMLAAALTVTPLGKAMGTLAVALAAVNVFGGFLVTRRMLEMFKKKDRSAAKAEGK
ncbi:hypothetical protein SSTU70S_01578 [Stutzerimonas stutzeri]